MSPPMDEVKSLRLPTDESAVRDLRAGDIVSLEGEVVLCAGVTTHQRIAQALAQGQALPIDLKGAALLHLGSYSEDVDGQLRLRYLNPTTSTRFNDFMPDIIRSQGLRVVGGKGGLDARSVAAMQAAGCVYLSFLGGGCTLLSRAVRELIAVEWRDLVPHYRLVKLRVQALGPATVGIDAHGNSLYDTLAQDAAQRLPDIMDGLATARRRAAGAAGIDQA
jgi:fumarate hydratase subunit beta